MLLINFGFEAAGSVPDFEGYGFLAGSLGSLFILYPLAAALLTSRISRSLFQRYSYAPAEIARCGARIGLLGSMLYFAMGLGAADARNQAAPGALWILLPLYVLSCSLAGRLGAMHGVERFRVPALRGS
jgi:hypothetical protein